MARSFLFLCVSVLVLSFAYSAYGACYNNTLGELCNGQGNCLSDGTCKCNEAYGNANCTYQRKKQTPAFLLSFFLGGWGAERFYLGLIGTAVGKLILGLAACILPCIVGCVGGGLGFKGKEGSSAAVTIAGTCVVLLLSLAIFAWWLADVILTGTNKLEDHNGYKPKPW